MVRFEVVTGVTAAHVQVRFRFKPGHTIKISRKGTVLERDDLVVSFEAARPVGEAYNFFAGFSDNYLLVGRTTSGTQKLSEYDSGYNIEQYEIDVKENEKMDLLEPVI